MFRNPNARFLKPKYIEQTHEFFERYGPRALVMARFVPIVRTFITIVAGAGKMDPKKFFLWTGVGAVIWAPGITLLGHALGNVEFIHKNLEAALILLVFISLIPMVVEYVLARRRNRNNKLRRRPEARRTEAPGEQRSVTERKMRLGPDPIGAQ